MVMEYVLAITKAIKDDRPKKNTYFLFAYFFCIFNIDIFLTKYMSMCVTLFWIRISDKMKKKKKNVYLSFTDD